MKKNDIKLITKLCPPFGGCPAIFETETDYIVIGKLLDKDELSTVKDNIG